MGSPLGAKAPQYLSDSPRTIIEVAFKNAHKITSLPRLGGGQLMDSPRVHL